MDFPGLGSTIFFFILKLFNLISFAKIRSYLMFRGWISTPPWNLILQIANLWELHCLLTKQRKIILYQNKQSWWPYGVSRVINLKPNRESRLRRESCFVTRTGRTVKVTIHSSDRGHFNVEEEKMKTDQIGCVFFVLFWLRKYVFWIPRMSRGYKNIVEVND